MPKENVVTKKKRKNKKKDSTNNKKLPKKKVTAKKKRRYKKKAVTTKITRVIENGRADKKVKTKRRGNALRVKEVLIDWSEMNSFEKLCSEIFRQLEVPKKHLKNVLTSPYPFEDLRYIVAYRLEVAFLPYTFVNVNVGRVKPSMRVTMDAVIDQVLRESASRNPGTKLIIHEEDSGAKNISVPGPTDMGRSKFIRLIARSEWPSRENLPPPGPARNNELHRIESLYDQAVENFVTTSSSSEELHLFVTSYSWNQGYKYLLELINNPACDLNTALLVFWSSGAEYFQRKYKKPPARGLYGGHHRDAWDLVLRIKRNVEKGEYTKSAMPDEFKKDVVIVPADQRLWEMDSVMYGGAKSKSRKKKSTKKKRVIKKKIVAKNKRQHACVSSKSQLQLHLDILQGVTDLKIQYFAGNGQLVDGSSESHNKLEACHVTEGVACCFSQYTALCFDSQNKLTEIREYMEDSSLPEYEHCPLLQELVETGAHVYRQYELVQPFEFIPNKRGKNCIGGSPPSDFMVPTLSSGLVFQYLGLLNQSDPIFRLSHDLHLVYPLFIDFCMEVWVDYKDPLAPLVLNDKEISSLNWVEFKEGDDIMLEPVRFKTAPWPTNAKHGGHIGVPNWIQDPNIPVCPRTKKPMELICQLGDGELSRAEMKNSLIVNKLERTANFGLSSSKENSKWITGDGDLFIFFSRKSRLACYLYQGT